MGVEVIMHLSWPHSLDSLADVEKLLKGVDVVRELKYAFDALTRMLFAYMVVSGGDKTLQKAKTYLVGQGRGQFTGFILKIFGAHGQARSNLAVSTSVRMGSDALRRDSNPGRVSG
ncbi:hypothetical protein EV122DRAFT_285187 [Schizophyllum commune]